MQVIYGMIVTMEICMFTIMMEVHHSGLILVEQVQKEKKVLKVLQDPKVLKVLKVLKDYKDQYLLLEQECYSNKHQLQVDGQK